MGVKINSSGGGSVTLDAPSTASNLTVTLPSASGTLATTDGGNTTFTSITDSGNLTFTGTGNRILGDFSNSTVASRVAFQNSGSNLQTVISAIPSGTGTVSQVHLYNNSDPTNASFAGLLISGSEARLQSGIQGTGTYYPLNFYTGGSERMRLDTSGNVGIGTSSPTGRISVVGSDAGSLARIDASNGTVKCEMIPYAGLGYYGTTTSHPVVIQTAGVEKMRIDSSGNVGIGTSSPALQLDVANGARAKYVQILNNGYAGTAATTPELYSPASATLAIGAGGAERMRIDSSGNLLVGTTSTSPGYGNTNVGVQISSAGSMFSRSSTDYTMSVNNNTLSSGNYRLMVFRAADANVGNISSNGTGVTYATGSDYRLKENIQPMQNALSVVAQLNPVTYTWKADGSDGQGFIAHELQAVVPDCVSGDKDAVDAEGKPVYQGIDTSFLVATLTKAIQELKAELDELKAKVQ